MRFFKNWWFVTISCALLLILLLAVGLPYFVAFLRPLWVRIACVILVTAIWCLLAYLRRRNAKQAADALAAELAGPNAADEEGKALSGRMRDALGQLKTASGKRRDYLYTRPWYVIIGPPGSGKTTALLNSGLRFPFSEQALKGVGGTRNLDFWFADEAVMVDTAGRYTTQDSDYQVDSKGWMSFLSLLKKHRPLQPINGVLVAIGVDELVRSDCAGIDAHARAVRRRLVELRKSLEVAAPVYVMLTKADLIAGFTQYFEDLDVEGRRAVLGSTLPFGTVKPGGEQLAQAFDEMAQAIADRQAKRLFEESDPMRRGMLLGFPAQFQSLRSRLMRFLDGAFVAGDEQGGILRGFYLTSGVQEGAPLDRILSSMADLYDRPADPGPSSSGRAYFLNRLLTEVLFPEAGLVTSDPAARNRQRMRLAGAFAGIATVAVLTMLAWGISFAGNRSFQENLLASSTAAAQEIKTAGIDLRQVRGSDPDVRAALPALNALRNLPRGYGARQQGGPPLSMTFGLYQAGLSRQAEDIYREALRRILLPRLMLRLEQFLASNASDPMQLYEPLKVYLILGQQGPMDARAVQAWVTGDWAANVLPGSDSETERKQLAQHLKALLDDRNLAGAWAGRKPPLNGALVAQARAAVGTLSLADRAYAVMKQRAASAGPDWSVANILSQGDAIAFANPDKLRGVQVPYFFTREGFEKTYTVGLATVQQDLKKDLWVFGSEAGSGLRDEMSNVRPGVAGAYAKEYIAAWEGVIAAMEPAPYFTGANPLAAYGAITKTPSPLKRVLLELRKNTIFAGGVQAGVNRAVQDRLNRTRASQYVQEFGAGRAMGLDAGSEITNYFSQVHDYVGDGKQPAPIDEFIAALKEAGKALAAARSMGASAGFEANQAQAATASAAVQTAAALAPPQLQDFATKAAGGGRAAQTSAASGAVGEAYATSVLPSCREVAQEHYPFFGGAKADAQPVDMLRVFGMGGTVDAFVQQRLKPMMEVSGPIWRWRSDDPVAATLDPSSPEQFAKAAEIRDLLVGSLPVKVGLAQLGSAVSAAEFSSGGTSYRFDAPGGPLRPLIWSMTGGLPEARVVLFGAGGKAEEIDRVEASGPWALFRLMDKARRDNAGARSVRVTFGDGAKAATFTVELPSERNPFSRGGLWSFRCPSAL